MTDNNVKNDELLLAKMALLAQYGTTTPEGEKPSDEELAMLIDDQLDFTRKQQVFSHINANQTLMTQWLNLVDIMSADTTNILNNAEENAKTKNSKAPFFTRLGKWLKSWQGISTGLATSCAVALVILMQPSLELTPQIATQPQVANSDTNKKTPNKQPITAPQFISPDKRAIAAGLLTIVNPSNVHLFTEFNLSNSVEQNGSSLTPSLYQQYFELGQLLAQQHLHCKAEPRPPKLQSKQLTKITELTNAIAEHSFIPLDKDLAAISTMNNSKAKPSTEQLCQQVENFLMFAL